MRRVLNVFIVSLLVFIFSGCSLINISESVFALNGESEVNVEVFNDYTEEGVVALDKNGNELEYLVSGTVNTSVLGSYIITYTVDGLDPLTRVINVVDTTPPLIEVENQTITRDDTDIDWSMYYKSVYDNYDATVEVSEEDDGVEYGVPGSYSVTLYAKDSSNNETTVTFNVYVDSTLFENPNGFYNFKFAPDELKDTFMAAAEKYLMNNMYGGVPLFSNATFTLYSSRLLLPVEEPATVVGMGIRFATMSHDDSYVKMDDGEYGNTGEYTLRLRIGANIQTFNQWLYDTSSDGALMGQYYGQLYDYAFNADKTGYEVVPVMASADPVPINGETLPNGRVVSDVWHVSIREGLVWKYHPDTDISNLPNGHEVIDANDFILTFKKALEEGWFRAVAGGADFITSPVAVKGASNYHDLWDDDTNPYSFDDVGLKIIDDYTIEFEFEDEQSEWALKYWLASYVMTPVHLDLLEQLGSEYGTSESTIAYHGAYTIDYYEESKIIRMIKNENYAMPEWDFYTHKTYIVQTDSNIAFAEFEAGRLDVGSVPPEKLETYKDDPRLKKSVSSSTYRIMINGLGTIEKQRSQFPGGTWVPEPILANQDFKMALFFAIDRRYLAEDVIMTKVPNMYYFSESYVLNPLSGLSFRNSEAGMTVGEGLSPSSHGYSKDAATALFRKAVATLIEEGTLEQGSSMDDPTVIEIEFNYFDNNDSQVTLFNYLKETFEDTFVDDNNFVVVKLIGVKKLFPSIYYDYMMTGEFDLSIGAISGFTLAASAYLDYFSSDNRSGFTLNWGIDTSVAEILINYTDPVDGQQYEGYWSFDAINSVLNGEIYLEEGRESKVPAVKDIELTPTTITFTIDRFDSSHYQNITFTLKTYNAVTGMYDNVAGYVDVTPDDETVTLTGITPGYGHYPVKYIGNYIIEINYAYRIDETLTGTNTTDWWLQPSTIDDYEDNNTETSLDINIVLDEDYTATISEVSLLDMSYTDTGVSVTISGLQLTASDLLSDTGYVFEITYSDGVVDYLYVRTKKTVE